MNSIDLTPLYRSSIGYDRVGSLIDNALRGANHSTGYPPYNIEIIDENNYSVALAVAGFEKGELDINVENNVLTIRGKKEADDQRQYLYQGIAHRTFERKFNLAEHVEVTEAGLNNGLLTVNLVKEIPEAMKPKSIAINETGTTVEHRSETESPDVKAA